MTTGPLRHGAQFGLTSAQLAAAHDWAARIQFPRGAAQRAALDWAMRQDEFTPAMLEAAMLARGEPIMDGYKLIQRLVVRGWVVRLQRGVYVARFRSVYARWSLEQATVDAEAFERATADAWSPLDGCDSLHRNSE